MPATAEAGTGQARSIELKSGLPHWVAETQVPEPSAGASHELPQHEVTIQKDLTRGILGGI